MTEKAHALSGRGEQIRPRISTEVLDILMPMHVIVRPGGKIAHLGRTLRKVMKGGCIGCDFFELFESRRPHEKETVREVCLLSGGKFALRLRDPDRTPLVGAAACLGEGQGVLINLSFGIAVVDAVARFGLAASDFAATDLTMELLYLAEANAAAMAESRRLNARLRRAHEQAEAAALSDSLTGLENRRALDMRFERRMRKSGPFALLTVDLDFFKQVNDTLGHAAGDEVLEEVARILREETRENDVVARIGGDEFVLLIDNAPDKSKLEGLARRLVKRIEEPIATSAGEARISASIGITLSADYDAPSLEALMHDADLALYSAKNAGRAGIWFHGHAAEK